MVQGSRVACIEGILDKLRGLCPLQEGWSFVLPIEGARLGEEHRGTVMDGVSNASVTAMNLSTHGSLVVGGLVPTQGFCRLHF